jgi:hypothetical protein
MHQTHDHGLRADPLCDGAQDQTKAAYVSAELRKSRPSSSRVRRRTINDKLSTKLRWNLTADEAELAALSEAAGACPDRPVMYDPAPRGRDES